jgi:hypothetical protein
VESNALKFGSFVGPLEVAGAMRWDLGDLEPGEVLEHTVLFLTGHSPAGLPPSHIRIHLQPEIASNQVGSSHTLTAMVTKDDIPVRDLDMYFEVVDGPHAGVSGAATTNELGSAQFSYVGALEGLDSILATSDVDGDGSVEQSNLAMKDWLPASNRAPDCSQARPSVQLIWPPNHRFVDVEILGVFDPDGDTVTVVIDSVWQDEPIDTTGDGAFTPDAQGLGTSVVQIRAERCGTRRVPGNGRIYHVRFTADDGKGGTCSGEVLVGVPHDQGGDMPVDDGALYDSTGGAGGY